MLFRSINWLKSIFKLISPLETERPRTNQRSQLPRLHLPGTIQAGCPSHPRGCHYPTAASCSPARLLLRRMGNADADLGVLATLLIVVHLSHMEKYSWIGTTSNRPLSELMLYVLSKPGLGGHHRSPSRREPARRQPPSSSSPFWSSRVERQFSLSARVKSCFLGKAAPVSS